MIEKKIRNTIHEHNLIEKNQHIVIGLSGGPDSVCLFYVLLKMSEEMNWTIHPVHVNHKFRPGAAEADQKYVEELCKSKGLECSTFVYDCAKLAEEEKITSEEAGRNVRYGAFAQVAQDLEEQGILHEDIKIAVAQNADDQAETILFRILRGTGVDGVAGISYSRTDSWGTEIVRPLLDVYKSEVLQYCEENQLNPCIDKTNEQPIYTRNKIRLGLIPELEQNFNNNIKDALIRLGKTAAMDKEYLWSQAKAVFDKAALEIKDDYIILSGDVLGQSHKALRQRVISIALNLIGLEEDVSFAHFQSASEIIDNTKPSARLDLPKGYYLTKVYENVKVAREVKSNKKDIKITKLDINEYRNLKLKPGTFCAFDYDCMIQECGKDCENSIVLRNRLAGDYIYLGEKLRKKLQDFFVDRKIPKDIRDHINLVGIGNEILWILIPGEKGRFSKKFNLCDSTKNVICIEIMGSI